MCEYMFRSFRFGKKQANGEVINVVSTHPREDVPPTITSLYNSRAAVYLPVRQACCAKSIRDRRRVCTIKRFCRRGTCKQ